MRSLEAEAVAERLGVVVPAVAAVELRDVLGVLAQREVVVEHRVVGEERRGGPGLDVAQVEPGDLELAVAGVEQAGDHAQERGLARAVVADERDRLADRHGERRAAGGRRGRRRSW